MNHAPKIAVVGSANTDLLFKGSALPRAGETIFGTGFDLGFGGKGANQAVAARFCGASVAMVAAVGDDLLGSATIDNFRAVGIDASYARTVADAATGAAFIFVEPSGENRIIVAKGANDALCPADVDAAADIIGSADIILLQFEIPLETVYHTLRFARARGIRSVVNPAPALSEASLPELVNADYLVVNEIEAQIMAGRPVESHPDLDACIDHLLSAGFRHVLLTLGAKGVVVASPGSRTHVSSFPVDVVDTTGAGDAFIGSLATFLAEGDSDVDAARRAGLYAAMSATRTGTQKSFPRRAEFDAELQRRGGQGLSGPARAEGELHC